MAQEPRASPSRERIAGLRTAVGSPGRALKYTGRLDFERNEKVMPQAPPSAVEAKTWVQETYGPDHLGVRPRTWSTSVWTDHNKHTTAWSRWKMWSADSPNQHPKPSDHALVYRSNQRFEVEASGALGAGQSRSINFTKRAYSGPWNATVVLTNGEKQRSLEAQTVAATANSRRVHVGQSYASPSMRQTMLSESMRAKKREEMGQERQFMDTYGPDWERMLQKTREIGARPRAPPKARRERPLRREDADALAELDRFTPPRGRPSIASKSKRSQRQPISRQVRPAAPEDSQHVPAT